MIANPVLQFPIQVQPPPLVDDPAVAEVFADNLAGLTINNGNVNLTLATVRADHTKTPSPNLRKVTSRLVIPLPVAVELHALLGQVLTELEAKGIIKRAPVMMPSNNDLQ
jgi:hypothetical protein